VIAEATRFPQLGKVFFDQGPARTIEALTDALRRFDEQGVLRVEHPAVAATQFNWLVMGEPLNQAMLLGLERPPHAKDLDQWASAAVTTFLSAFRTRE
jgi:hypothetical protein